MSVVFSPRGSVLATAGADRTVHLWRTNPEQAIRPICAATHNTFGAEQWGRYVSGELPFQPPCP